MYPQQPYGNPYPGYAPPPPPPPSPEQIREAIVMEIRRLRSDLTQAYNPYSLQKILDSTLQLMEYMLAGAVVHANPNQIPGRPVDPLDSGKTRVEFFGGPQAPAAPAMPGYGSPPPAFPVAPGPSYPGLPGMAPVAAPPAPGQPVVNGDVSFVRTSPAPQGVELYGGPPGSPHAAPAQAYERNGQRVEFFPNPPGTPVTGAPPQQPPPPPVATVNNPPTAQFTGTSPAVTVEAGHTIQPAHAPMPAAGLPVAPPFATVMPVAGSSAPGYVPPPPPPRTREELLAMLPIPTS